MNWFVMYLNIMSSSKAYFFRSIPLEYLLDSMQSFAVLSRQYLM